MDADTQVEPYFETNPSLYAQAGAMAAYWLPKLAWWCLFFLARIPVDPPLSISHKR